jgi:hypothetical protein
MGGCKTKYFKPVANLKPNSKDGPEQLVNTPFMHIVSMIHIILYNSRRQSNERYKIWI